MNSAKAVCLRWRFLRFPLVIGGRDAKGCLRVGNSSLSDNEVIQLVK